VPSLLKLNGFLSKHSATFGSSRYLKNKPLLHYSSSSLVASNYHVREFSSTRSNDEDCVLLEVDDCFATITLNRPKVHNAMSETVISSLHNRLKEVSELVKAENKSSIRALFLKSNGKNFSAGADLEYMKRLGEYPQEKNFEDAMQLSSMFNSLGNQIEK